MLTSGLDRVANLLEVIVIIAGTGDDEVMPHAMPRGVFGKLPDQ